MGYLNARQRRLLDEIASWDGCYEATSHGALAFEVLCQNVARALISGRRRAAYGAACSHRWPKLAA